MPTHVIDLGTNAAGVRQQAVVREDRVTFKTQQSDTAVQAVLKKIHEANRDGFNKKAAWRPVASVPVLLREQWRREWLGQTPGQRRSGDAPCKHVPWLDFLNIKLSQYEHSKLRFK